MHFHYTGRFDARAQNVLLRRHVVLGAETNDVVKEAASRAAYTPHASCRTHHTRHTCLTCHTCHTCHTHHTRHTARLKYKIICGCDSRTILRIRSRKHESRWRLELDFSKRPADGINVQPRRFTMVQWRWVVWLIWPPTRRQWSYKLTRIMMLTIETAGRGEIIIVVVTG